MPQTKSQKQSSKPQTNKDSLGIRKVGKKRQHRSFVFYGRSGTGKTTLASTFPKPVLVLDCRDQGEDSISDVEDVFIKEIETEDDLEAMYWYLKKNPDEFATVVIDTMTGLQQIMVEEIAGNGKGNRRPGEWGTMRKQDWGEVASKLKRIIDDWRDLPMEVVFNAQDRTFNLGDDEVDDDSQLAPEVGPALMPSVVKTLNAAVSVIGNTFIRSTIVSKKDAEGKKKEVRKIKYCLRVGPNPIHITKIRKRKSTVAPDFIEDPTYEDILSIIQGDE